MADITDPEIVRYVNVYLRPFAERLRDLKAALSDATSEYAANVSGLLGAYVAQDVVVDGRASEGIGQATKLEVNRMRSLMEALEVVLADATTTDPDELMATFTVRPLAVG